MTDQKNLVSLVVEKLSTMHSQQPYNYNDNIPQNDWESNVHHHHNQHNQHNQHNRRIPNNQQMAYHQYSQQNGHDQHQRKPLKPKDIAIHQNNHSHQHPHSQRNNNHNHGQRQGHGQGHGQHHSHNNNQPQQYHNNHNNQRNGQHIKSKHNNQNSNNNMHLQNNHSRNHPNNHNNHSQRRSNNGPNTNQAPINHPQPRGNNYHNHPHANHNKMRGTGTGPQTIDNSPYNSPSYEMGPRQGVSSKSSSYLKSNSFYSPTSPGVPDTPSMQYSTNTPSNIHGMAPNSINSISEQSHSGPNPNNQLQLRSRDSSPNGPKKGKKHHRKNNIKKGKSHGNINANLRGAPNARSLHKQPLVELQGGAPTTSMVQTYSKNSAPTVNGGSTKGLGTAPPSMSHSTSMHKMQSVQSVMTNMTAASASTATFQGAPGVPYSPDTGSIQSTMPSSISRSNTNRTHPMSHSPSLKHTHNKLGYKQNKGHGSHPHSYSLHQAAAQARQQKNMMQNDNRSRSTSAQKHQKGQHRMANLNEMQSHSHSHQPHLRDVASLSSSHNNNGQYNQPPMPMKPPAILDNTSSGNQSYGTNPSGDRFVTININASYSPIDSEPFQQLGLADYKQMETFLQDPPSNEYYDGNGQQGPPNRLQLGRADTAPMVHGHMQQNQPMNMQPSNYGGYQSNMNMWKVDEDVELSGGGQIYDYPMNQGGPPRSRRSESHSHSHGGQGYDNYGSPGPQPGPQQPPRSQPPPQQPPQNPPPRQTQHGPQGPHQQRPTLQQKASYNQRNQMYANKHKGNPQLYPQQPHNHMQLQNFHSQPQPDDYNGYNPHISHGQHPNSFDTGGRNMHHNNPNPEYNHHNQRSHGPPQNGHPHQRHHAQHSGHPPQPQPGMHPQNPNPHHPQQNSGPMPYPHQYQDSNLMPSMPPIMSNNNSRNSAATAVTRTETVHSTTSDSEETGDLTEESSSSRSTHHTLSASSDISESDQEVSHTPSDATYRKKSRNRGKKKGSKQGRVSRSHTNGSSQRQGRHKQRPKQVSFKQNTSRHHTPDIKNRHVYSRKASGHSMGRNEYSDTRDQSYHHGYNYSAVFDPRDSVSKSNTQGINQGLVPGMNMKQPWSNYDIPEESKQHHGNNATISGSSDQYQFKDISRGQNSQEFSSIHYYDPSHPSIELNGMDIDENGNPIHRPSSTITVQFQKPTPIHTPLQTSQDVNDTFTEMVKDTRTTKEHERSHTGSKSQTHSHSQKSAKSGPKLKQKPGKFAQPIKFSLRDKEHPL